MIYHANNAEQLSANFEATKYSPYIKQEDARDRFKKGRDEKPKETFAQFIDRMNYRILD